MSRAKSLSVLVGALGLSVAWTAAGVTRTEALVRAKAYSFHPWKATNANTTASCNAAYKSIYTPGDYMGLAYDWGGYMTLFEYDQQLKAGNGAGSYPADGILSCTSGVDCSGFVSQCWKAGHHTTSNVDTISSAINQNAMLAGDIFNDAGNHMAMYSLTLGSGEPLLYEAVFENAHISMPGWSWVQGYVPRKYQSITGTSAAEPDGTWDKPVVIGSFPYGDSRNTTQSMSDVIDGCAIATGSNESGPEYVYQVTFSQPGQVTVSVADDVGVDIDVHLYTSMNTNDCVARHDSTFTQNVDCGTYYVVADTFSDKAGTYSLTVDFAPSGSACGSGPPKYQFKGAPGTDCAYPGNESLPFCNPNLGTDTCLYTSSSSFCSMACTGASDCAAMPGGGCCSDIGNGELYCLPQAQCGSTQPDGGVNPGTGGSGSGGVPSAGGTGAGGEPAAGGASNQGGSGDVPSFGGNSGAVGGGGPTPLATGDTSGCSTRTPSRSGSGVALLLGALGLSLLRRRHQ
jgi:MYXO-CTERM domain-containing protein